LRNARPLRDIWTGETLAFLERKRKPLVRTPRHGLFLRFGSPPRRRSWNHWDDIPEKGISVYAFVRRGRYVIPHIPRFPYIEEADGLQAFFWLRQAYVVKGTTMRCRGSDNEPLLRTCRVVRKATAHMFRGERMRQRALAGKITLLLV
jgi:hypothetical protein